MPHVSTQSESSSSVQTQTPITGGNFQDVLAQLLEKIGEFEAFDPADLFNQLSEGSPFLEQLSQALADSFQPFVKQQLGEVQDMFRRTGNESALSGTGGPNRLTQVAIPQALAAINQQFGGQLTGLVSSALGDLLGANQLQQQGNLGLIDQLNRALGNIPTGQQTNTSGTAFSRLFTHQAPRLQPQAQPTAPGGTPPPITRPPSGGGGGGGGGGGFPNPGLPGSSSPGPGSDVELYFPPGGGSPVIINKTGPRKPFEGPLNQPGGPNEGAFGPLP